MKTLPTKKSEEIGNKARERGDIVVWLVTKGKKTLPGSDHPFLREETRGLSRAVQERE